MRILIACEYSGRVREAFRALGHDAWSCDLLPSEDQSEFHLEGDVLSWIDFGRPVCNPRSRWADFPRPRVDGPWLPEPWDLMIAHPPCTHLSVSGAAHFEEKRADGRQQEAIDFFMALARAPIPRIAIENPVCIMSTVWREPDQIIHPYEFGHPEFKTTCLWLKGLPPLRPTNRLTPPEKDTPEWVSWNKVHRMSPGDDRWKNRSRTYQGIADAFAHQWHDYTDLVTQMEAA